MRVRDNWAPCSHCGEPVEQDDSFRIIKGNLVHEGDCADEWRANGPESEATAVDAWNAGKAAE